MVVLAELLPVACSVASGMRPLFGLRGHSIGLN